MTSTATTARRASVAAVCLVAGVVLAAGVSALAGDWRPVSDWALIEGQVRDVGGSHTPLVGVYSRFGWRHPGPWPLWLLAVPYRLTGGASVGLLLGAAGLNLVAVLGAARVAWRRGGPALMLLTAIGLALLLTSLGTDLLVDPWNPWLPILAMVWFAFLAWDVACGHRWSVPVLVVVGSLAVQSHIGTGPVIAALGGAGAVVLLARSRDAEAATGPPWRVVLAVAGLAAALLWGPVVVEQVTAEDGNLGQLWDFFVAGGSDDAVDFFGNPAEPVGLGDGARILARETGGRAPWMGGPEPHDALGQLVGRSPALLLHPAFLLVGVAAVGWRLRREELLFGAGLVLVGLLAAWASLAHILGQATDYLVRWAWPLALFLHVLAAWALLLGVRRRHDPPPATAWIGVGLLGVWAVFTVPSIAGLQPPRDEFAVVAEALVPVTVAWVEDRGGGPVAVRADGVNYLAPAVVLGLQRAGEEVLVEGPLSASLPLHRRRGDEEVPLTLVVARPEARARLEAEPGTVLVAEHAGDRGDSRMPPVAVLAISG